MGSLMICDFAPLIVSLSKNLLKVAVDKLEFRLPGDAQLSRHSRDRPFEDLNGNDEGGLDCQSRLAFFTAEPSLASGL